MCGEGALVQCDAGVVVTSEVRGSGEQIEVVRGQDGECVGAAESVQARGHSRARYAARAWSRTADLPMLLPRSSAADTG